MIIDSTLYNLSTLDIKSANRLPTQYNIYFKYSGPDVSVFLILVSSPTSPPPSSPSSTPHVGNSPRWLGGGELGLARPSSVAPPQPHGCKLCRTECRPTAPGPHLPCRPSRCLAADCSFLCARQRSLLVAPRAVVPSGASADNIPPSPCPQPHSQSHPSFSCDEADHAASRQDSATAAGASSRPVRALLGEREETLRSPPILRCARHRGSHFALPAAPCLRACTTQRVTHRLPPIAVP
jgi:hypothetical protein